MRPARTRRRRSHSGSEERDSEAWLEVKDGRSIARGVRTPVGTRVRTPRAGPRVVLAGPLKHAAEVRRADREGKNRAGTPLVEGARICIEVVRRGWSFPPRPSSAVEVGARNRTTPLVVPAAVRNKRSDDAGGSESAGRSRRARREGWAPRWSLLRPHVNVAALNERSCTRPAVCAIERVEEEE
jgi:hypothetical protein